MGFYNHEISERNKYHYPPFYRIIKIILKSPDAIKVEQAAKFLTTELIEVFGSKRILGPQAPIVSRIRNQFLMDIYIKLERGKIELGKAKDLILQKVRDNNNLKKIGLVFDVDPV